MVDHHPFPFDRGDIVASKKAKKYEVLSYTSTGKVRVKAQMYPYEVRDMNVRSLTFIRRDRAAE